MFNLLCDHIRRFVPLTEADAQKLQPYVHVVELRKKQHLLQEGQLCKAQYFIAKGCFRQYVVNDKGQEQTTQFGIENWWTTDLMSFQQRTPALFNIQAIENATVLALERDDFEAALAAIPQLERYFRLVLQRAFAASQIRIRYLFTMGAKERYHHMNRMFPDFMQRVPQYMVASYLDFTPEFLSKIRAKM